MTEGFSDLAKLDHIDPTFAPLDFRHEALGAIQASGQFHLGNAGSLTGFNEESNEFLMPLREDR